MRLILEAHPDVVCYDEIRAYAILQSSAVEPLPPGFKLVGFKLPRWTEQLTRPVLFDEGASGVCRNFYRGEKILFLRRDVRDTIVSMLKLKAGQSSWCETWVPRMIKAKLAWESTFRTRYAEELSIIDNCGSRLVGLAALYWKYKNDAFVEYRRRGLPVLSVSYEDLVKNPGQVLQSVCRHLGISFHENLLRHNELPHNELFENGLTVGNTNPKLPIQTGSVGQWERFLSQENLRIIERIAGSEACGGGPSGLQPVFRPATPELSSLIG